MSTAAEYAAAQVAKVRDDPAGRLALLRSLYEAPPGLPELHLPYRRAALSFMGWQHRRGLLNSVSDAAPGSPWWRAVNERLLRDTAESRAHVLGMGGPVSSTSVAWSVAFVRRPSARTWYRAHNASIVTACLEHVELAEAESRVERFFINLVLVRVLYAHALVAAPRLALSLLSPIGPLLGDPRLGMTGIFLSLSRVLPDRYPLSRDLQQYVADEHGLVAPRPGRDPATPRRALRLVRGRVVPSRAHHTAQGRCARLRLGRHRRGALEPVAGPGGPCGATGASSSERGRAAAVSRRARFVAPRRAFGLREDAVCHVEMASPDEGVADQWGAGGDPSRRRPRGGGVSGMRTTSRTSTTVATGHRTRRGRQNREPVSALRRQFRVL